jgi:hypothetical protein
LEESSAIVERAREELCAVSAGGIGQIAYATTANNLIRERPAAAQAATYLSAFDLLSARAGVHCVRCGRRGALLHDPRATFQV